jgi:hypothetical protein
MIQSNLLYTLCYGQERERKNFRSALEIMLKIFPWSQPDTWNRCEVFLSHALTVTSCPEISNEKLNVSNLLSKISHYFYSQVRSREKEPVDLEVLALRKEVLGERHPDTIKSMANLATTYYQQGRSKIVSWCRVL